MYLKALWFFLKNKKDVNRDFHTASSPKKLRGYMEFLKFDVTIKKNIKYLSLKFKGLN